MRCSGASGLGSIEASEKMLILKIVGLSFLGLWLGSYVFWFRDYRAGNICSCDGEGPWSASWHVRFCIDHCLCNSCKANRAAKSDLEILAKALEKE